MKSGGKCGELYTLCFGEVQLFRAAGLHWGTNVCLGSCTSSSVLGVKLENAPSAALLRLLGVLHVLEAAVAFTWICTINFKKKKIKKNQGNEVIHLSVSK